MQIEMDSSRTKLHQSGFPQTRQGLRRLTRQKMFEADVCMTTVAARFFPSPLRKTIVAKV